MAEYRVYRDYGDFGREYVCDAVSMRQCLTKIVKDSKGGSPSEFTVRFQGDWLATVYLDQCGNYRAEVLTRREYPVDQAYSVGIWTEYWLNSDGQWVEGGAEAYHTCTGE